MADWTKAVFIKSYSQGARTWRRADVNLVSRNNKTYLELILGGGHTPGRARDWNTAQGEEYDDVVFYDFYPRTWPRIGNVAG